MEVLRIVFLNVPIVTSEGCWQYQLFPDLEATKKWLHANEWSPSDGHEPIPTLSAVGHESTAEAMTELLGVPVKLNRIQYNARPGDACLVMKLRGRLPEGEVLDREQLDSCGYDFGLLTMENSIQVHKVYNPANPGDGWDVLAILPYNESGVATALRIALHERAMVAVDNLLPCWPEPDSTPEQIFELYEQRGVQRP